MRKYMSEFGLNVYAKLTTLISPTYLEALERRGKHKYHIYGIVLVPKFFIKENSFELHQDHIRLNIFTNAFGSYSEYTVGFSLDNKLNHEYVRCSTTYPHSLLKLSIDDEEWSKRYSKKEVTIPAMDLFDRNAESLMSRISCKVLYIGQAYGKRGERSAIKRLSSHETLQKILIETQINYPEYEVKILLMEMDYCLGFGINPLAKAKKDNEEDSEHVKAILENLPQEQQVINITEAALINYFRPQYNVMFVENFPSSKHKSYRQYYDLDYDDLVIEIPMEYDNYPSVELFTEHAQLSFPQNYIHYQLDNTEERESMYSIFQ